MEADNKQLVGSGDRPKFKNKSTYKSVAGPEPHHFGVAR
jgi:hypothetical protein